MRRKNTKATIVLDDAWGFIYRISGIEYSIDEEGHFEYVFTPCYPVIDMLDASLFQGIQGLDLDLRLEKYVRKDIVPTFISERTPSENREDLWELLEAVDLDHLNRLEWLIRTNLRYSGDRLFVVRDNYDEAVYELHENQSMSTACKQILKRICMGLDVKTQDYEITDSNRKQMYRILYSLYCTDRQNINNQIRRSTKGRAGRKPKEIEIADLLAMRSRLESGSITYEKAAHELEISRATLFRKLKTI